MLVGDRGDGSKRGSGEVPSVAYSAAERTAGDEGMLLSLWQDLVQLHNGKTGSVQS